MHSSHLLRSLARQPDLVARHGLAALLADDHPGLLELARTQVAAGLKTKRLTLKVVDALLAAGVTPVLLKGYALALRLYPEQPLGRPASDVDVLVAPAELDRCAAALATVGLARVHDAGLEDPLLEHHHLSFAGPAGLVEAHFRLFTGFGGGAFDEAGLARRTRAFRVDGRPVRVLGPEDELLYLATHAANHSFLRLSWLVDLARYLEREPGLDWAVMARRAHRAGFHTAVTTALHVSEQLLGVELPLAARRHFPTSALRRELDARVFSGQLVASARLSNDKLAGFLLRLALVDTPAHAVRHLLEGARRYVRRRRSEG